MVPQLRSLAEYAGKPLIVSLIYTSCYHICPTTTQHIAAVVRKARKVLGAVGARVIDAGVAIPKIDGLVDEHGVLTSELWLGKLDAGGLKLKVAASIVAISSIHLLRTFIEAGALGSGKGNYTETGVMWQTIIHTVFILSAMGIAYVDRLSTIATEEAKHTNSH